MLSYFLCFFSEPVQFVKLIEDQTVDDEMTAVFQCEVNKPNMTANWYKNGTPLKRSDKYDMSVEDTKHTLNVKHCQKFDSGQFSVVVDDAECAASLSVNAVDVVLIKPLEDITVQETPTTVVFTCELSKPDLPAIWSKNGKPEEISRRLKAKNEGNIYSLTINKAMPEDEGEYSLRVKAITTSCKLKFLIKPSVKVAKKYDDVVVIKAGQSTAFEIPVEGYPQPKVVWQFKGEPLPKAKRYETETQSGMTSLRVKQAVREDRGVFTVSVTNEVCEVSADITLEVLDVPSSPIDVTAKDLQEESVSLEWKEPDDSGGSDVTHYIVEKKEVGKRAYSQCGQPTTRKMTVDGLKEGHSYVFQITAVNDVGMSEPTELSSPVTPVSSKSKLGHFLYPNTTSTHIHYVRVYLYFRVLFQPHPMLLIRLRLRILLALRRPSPGSHLPVMVEKRSQAIMSRGRQLVVRDGYVRLKHL